MTDKEKLIKIKSLADKMYDAAFNLTTDASLLRKAMKKYRQFIINEYHKEEPASEELEDAASSFARKDSEGISNPANFYYTVADKARIFKAGAQWQKEQMMVKAIDAQCFGFQGAALFSFKLPADKYLVGSKVKVIVIKED